MTTRLATISLVLAAALLDASGAHALAYYALVGAVPVGALAALTALGAILDGTAAAPLDRGLAVLSAIALPFLLLGTAVRAPQLDVGPPPVVGVTAVVACLGIFALQALLAATSVMPRRRLRSALRAKKQF
jgi:hypothetical protein